MTILMRRSLRSLPTQTKRTLKDEFRLAAKLTGKRKRSVLIRLALEALIEWESARALAKMGSSQPGLKRPRRRRSGAA